MTKEYLMSEMRTRFPVSDYWLERIVDFIIELLKKEKT